MAAILLRSHHSLQANLGGFGPVIVIGHLLEPIMVQSLLRSDALCRIIHKDLPQQISEILEKCRRRRDNVLMRRLVRWME
jgi:hypothetical protein